MRGHFRALEATSSSAPVNRFHRRSLVVREGEATATFEVRPEYHHAAGAMYGWLDFKALDGAAFFAANSLVEDRLPPTGSFTVQVFRPVVEGALRAHGLVVHRTRRPLIAEMALTAADGGERARGSGTFAPSSIALDQRVGYPGVGRSE